MTIAKEKSLDGLALMAIIKRAMKMAREHQRYDIESDQGGLLMDILYVHEHVYPMRLPELATADDANFAHDIFGIYRHFNRETKQMEDGFSPRYSIN